LVILCGRHDRLRRKSYQLLGRICSKRNLELIGEAATHIPDEVRAATTHVPWRMIIATRNRLIHGYLGIDNDTLWSIIHDDVPQLLPKLRLLRDAAK